MNLLTPVNLIVSNRTFLGTYEVVLTGLLWGGINCDTNGANCTSFIYSTLKGVNSELGYF